MLDLIATAYNIDRLTVLGGPNWLERNRFDVAAKAPAGTPREELQAMLRSLLAERFRLRAHTETRPLSGTVLRVKGTPTMTASLKEERGACLPSPAPQAVPSAPPTVSLACRNVTMESFAQQLRQFGSGYVDDRVVDSTGLRGRWDFDLRFTSKSNVAIAGAEAVTLLSALEKLGLTLTRETIETPVLNVDSVDDKPIPDPSGSAAALPDGAPGEFDVADIKLSPPDARPSGRLLPTGRLDFQAYTLKQLVKIAWDISDDELIAGAPRWFDSTGYTIVARISPGVAGNSEGVVFDLDDLRLMMQALLKSRFQMAVHREERPVSAYALTLAGDPKLRTADPANRTRFINGPAPGTKDPRDSNPVLNRFVTCQNMTMAQFAEDLPRIAGTYIKEPVTDATGLKGAFDFTLSFSTLDRVRPSSAAGIDGRVSDTLTASDPTGALSLFDAVQKQLGLKLELRKRPLPVLVIDHVEERPIGN